MSNSVKLSSQTTRYDNSLGRMLNETLILAEQINIPIKNPQLSDNETKSDKGSSVTTNSPCADLSKTKPWIYSIPSCVLRNETKQAVDVLRTD